MSKKLLPYIMIVIIVVLSVFSVVSLIEINQLKEEVTILNEKYDWGDANLQSITNEDAKYVFSNYNDFYAGYSDKGTSSKIYITNSSPLDLVNHLDSNGIAYEYVERSHNDLYSTGMLIFNIVVHEHDLVDINIDYDENLLVLTVLSLDYDLSYFQPLVDKGILIIEEGDYYKLNN